MKKLIRIASYLFVIALTVVAVKAISETDPLRVVSVMPECHMVIISEFGDPRLYQVRVCSDEDLARVYGEQKLREQAWINDHDCDDATDEAPELKRNKWRR